MIDIPADNGFENETTTSIALNFDGTSFDYVDEDGVTTNMNMCHVVDNCETVTEIRINNNGSSIDYKDEDGVTTNLHLCYIVDNCESVTSISYNSIENHLSYVDEDGITNIISLGDQNPTGGFIESLTELTYNNLTNQLLYIDENGKTNVIDIPAGNGFENETTTSIALNFDGTSFDYVDEDGVTTNMNMCHVVDNCETVTSLTYNGSNDQLIYIDENGKANVLDIPAGNGFENETTTSIALNFNGTSIDYVDEDGVTTNIDMCHVIDICETVTCLIETSNGLLVFTDENGDSNTLDVGTIREEDPQDSSKLIAYAPLSGPEQAIFERGSSRLVNGEVYIEFSDHFSKLIASNTMTVSLTPHSTNTYGLAVIEKNTGGIRVKELMNGLSDFSFDWEVKATRKSGLSFQVIRNK